MSSRGEAWVLTGVSGILVLAGVFAITVVEAVTLGAIGVLFFGATLLVGLLHLWGTSRAGSRKTTGRRRD